MPALFLELAGGLVAQREPQRAAGAADTDGDAGAAGDEGEPGIGGGLADGVGGGEPGQLVVERRKAGVGIDAEIVGELAPGGGAAGQRRDQFLLVRVGRRHRGIDAAEQIADALEGVADGLAGRGDQVLGGGERLERRAAGGIDQRAGAVDLDKVGGRGDLARANAQQIGATDGEGPALGVDPEHILEIVEADLIADGVIGAAQQVGRQHLARPGTSAAAGIARLPGRRRRWSRCRPGRAR